MRLEKKIIVGNARNAKLISDGWNPTSGTNDVKRKSLPASEKLINLEITLSKKPNTGFPMGVFKIKRAKISCRPNPHPTIRKLICFRLFDMATAMPKSVIIPNNPIIYSSGGLKQFLQRAS
jgi:hypothetical protein